MTKKIEVVEGNPPAPTLHPDVLRVMNRPGFVGTWKTAMKILAEEDKAWAEHEWKK